VPALHGPANLSAAAMNAVVPVAPLPSPRRAKAGGASAGGGTVFAPWVEYHTPDATPYFYNTDTKQTVWQLPV